MSFKKKPDKLKFDELHLQHAFSSDSSLQSDLPLQKSSLSRHSPSPQDSLPSGQMGSSVFRMGLALRGSVGVGEKEAVSGDAF